MGRTPLVTVSASDMTLRQMVDYIEDVRARAPRAVDFEFSDGIVWMVGA